MNAESDKTVLTDANFKRFRDLVFAQSGIHLSEHKRELVRTRLGKRIRALDLSGFNEYYDYIKTDVTGSEAIRMIDAISTNLTFFFRENRHFEHMRDVALPEIVADKRKRGDTRLRIWSSACSTGEEAYSIAIVVHEALGDRPPFDVKILATDISTEVLAAAARGLYRKEKLDGVPKMTLQKYFEPDRSSDDREMYAVKKDIRDMVTFRRLNLMIDKFPFGGKFAIVFCRNVMIYFNRQTQADLINKLYDVIEPGGYLFIGHSESLTSIEHRFGYVAPTVYQRGK